jgi:hypothetical protein
VRTPCLPCSAPVSKELAENSLADQNRLLNNKTLECDRAVKERKQAESQARLLPPSQSDTRMTINSSKHKSTGQARLNTNSPKLKRCVSLRHGHSARLESPLAGSRPPEIPATLSRRQFERCQREAATREKRSTKAQ